MIHPSAIISDKAVIAADVEIGPYSVIGDDVEIGSGTRIGSHVVINGPTVIGRDNRIYQFASIGDDPQDKKYADEPTTLTIGDRNTIREFCTVSRGTVQMGHDSAYYHRGKAPAAQFFTTVPFGMTTVEWNAWIKFGGGQALWDELADGFGLGEKIESKWTKYFTTLALVVGMGVAIVFLMQETEPVNLIIFAQALTVVGFPALALTLIYLGTIKHKENPKSIPAWILIASFLGLAATTVLAWRAVRIVIEALSSQ